MVGVKPARAGSGQVLVGAPFGDSHVDAREGQFGRQHQARRASAGDHHRMPCHMPPPALK
jgi:hypothetical protein